MSTGLTESERVRGQRGGFTLVELLVVISIIAILATLGLVMAGKALRTSKRAATTSLLAHIGTAMESFKNDFGDYPPLITRLADYSSATVNAPNAIATPEVWGERARLQGNDPRMALRYAYEDARWRSEWSIAAFLLGAGDLNGDGVEDKYDDGKEGFGFRHPGDYLAWTKVENGKLVHEPEDDGRVYGPYLEPGSTDKFVERVPVYYDNTTKRIEEEPNPQPTSQYMYRFVDSWGNPIRYYRNWRTYDPADPNRKASVDFAPVELRSYESLNRQYEDDATKGDIGLDADVMRAPYMLLAAGDDPSKYVYEDNGQLHSVAPFGDVVPSEDAMSVQRLQEGAYGSSFNPFGGGLSDWERALFFRMVESNVRYAP